jgi:hypothetical protein
MVQGSSRGSSRPAVSFFPPGVKNERVLEDGSNVWRCSTRAETDIDNRRQIGIMAGNSVLVIVHPQTREIVEIDPEQAWFWTREWQALEREAEADISAGRYTVVDDIDAYFSSL